MALWFWRGLARGVVTTRYPARADASSELLPTPPAFDSTQLTPATVASLIASCPSRALELESGALVLDLGRCTACGRCAAAAPSATRPSGCFELATRDRDRLRIRIPLAEIGP